MIGEKNRSFNQQVCIFQTYQTLIQSIRFPFRSFVQKHKKCTNYEKHQTIISDNYNILYFLKLINELTSSNSNYLSMKTWHFLAKFKKNGLYRPFFIRSATVCTEELLASFGTGFTRKLKGTTVSIVNHHDHKFYYFINKTHLQ